MSGHSLGHACHIWAYVDLFGFWGQAPAAKRFPGYYRGLRERWMRESRCYFFYHTPKKWGVRYPHSKKWGVRVRGYPPYPP